jgi:hypothetical protein
MEHRPAVGARLHPLGGAQARPSDRGYPGPAGPEAPRGVARYGGRLGRARRRARGERLGMLPSSSVCACTKPNLLLLLICSTIVGGDVE